MAKVEHKSAKEARNQLSKLLDGAAEGRSTIITRRGRPAAALVPLETYNAAARQYSITSLSGSGRGLWGRNSTRTIRALRDEWER